MKQGRASRDNNDGRKVEPMVHPVSPTAVSQIGSSLGNHAMDHGRTLPGSSKPLYPDKQGFQPPREREVEHYNGGSQGRRS